MAGVVEGIARPNKAVIGHMVQFFARDFAGFATDANSWISKETNLDVVAHVTCAGADLCCVCLRRSYQIRQALCSSDIGISVQTD